jgi:hypothetical protein
MLRTCQESGGNTSKPQSTWISVFAGSNSTMIKDRKFRKQERIRAACAILPLGAAMQSREDDNKLKEEGCWHDHRACRRSLSFRWSSAVLRIRGSRESFAHLARVRYRLPGVDPTQGQCEAMWAPALVPPPLIGRHRSKCSWGCSSHTLKQCLVQRMQRISERRSTLLSGTGRKRHRLLRPFSFQ